MNEKVRILKEKIAKRFENVSTEPLGPSPIELI